MSAEVRRAETVPTTSRDGEIFDEPRQVECAYCDASGPTEYEINLCDNCGNWFAVLDEASQKKAKEAGDS